LEATLTKAKLWRDSIARGVSDWNGVRLWVFAGVAASTNEVGGDPIACDSTRPAENNSRKPTRE
jgi:hypothetical protein